MCWRSFRGASVRRGCDYVKSVQGYEDSLQSFKPFKRLVCEVCLGDYGYRPRSLKLCGRFSHVKNENAGKKCASRWRQISSSG